MRINPQAGALDVMIRIYTDFAPSANPLEPLAG